MDEPRCVEEESVLRIHARQLQFDGGLAGVRDAGMLSLAMRRPRNLWTYQRDFAALSAAYAAGIAQDHPFIDGNKRTAAVVSESYLEQNGSTLAASDGDWYEAVLGIASGMWTVQDLAEWIRARLESMPR